jgi:hypothetical protein
MGADHRKCLAVETRRTANHARSVAQRRAGGRSRAVHDAASAKILILRKGAALAEGAVTSEPFSKPNSLLSRENTGNFRDLASLLASDAPP